jgi:hypothetical protein
MQPETWPRSSTGRVPGWPADSMTSATLMTRTFSSGRWARSGLAAASVSRVGIAPAQPPPETGGHKPQRPGPDDQLAQKRPPRPAADMLTANVSNMQISIAAGSALGGVLVDSAGLATVYTTAGAITLAAAVFALITGRHDRARRQRRGIGRRERSIKDGQGESRPRATEPSRHSR